MEVFEDWLKKHFPRLFNTYVDYNICKSYNAMGEEKPATLFYRICDRIFYWDCACCASIRGLIVGFLLGWGVRWLWTLAI